MIKETVTAFFQKMQADETLKKQFASIQSELQQQMMEQLADKLVTLGADSGFEFTTDELRDMYKTMANEPRELSDDEVDGVAGGTGFTYNAINTNPLNII
jgi:predicted ribosomally synthesized peptide with nif11-like leader